MDRGNQILHVQQSYRQPRGHGGNRFYMVSCCKVYHDANGTHSKHPEKVWSSQSKEAKPSSVQQHITHADTLNTQTCLCLSEGKHNYGHSRKKRVDAKEKHQWLKQTKHINL